MFFVYKHIIEKNILNDDGSINHWSIKRFKKYRPKIYNKIESIYAYSINENIFIIVNGYQGICKTCARKVSFQSFKKGYKQYCSASCSYKSTERLKNMKKTSKIRYGVENPSSHSLIKKKRKKTFEIKYGGIGANSNIIREKMTNTILEKYNVNNPSLIGKEKWVGIKDYLKTLIDEGFSKTDILRLTDYNIHPLTLGRYINTFIDGRSNGEIEIRQFLKGKDFNIQQNIRKVMNNKFELDIFIPEKNIAIEYNGVYWHSELNGKNKNYHLNKTIECNKKGIQLIHIFETEWLNKQEIVKSIISSKLGQYENRLYARQCHIKEITSKEKNQFLEENHLQGQDKSSVKLGLFHNDVLISVMTFGKSRYNKKYQWEMHRFCNKLNHQIVGGASKLWTYFIRNYNPESVITYADRRYSDGTFYEKIGFNKIGESKPNYFYFKDRGDEYGKLLSRIQFQKHKLKDKLDKFDPDLTEWENMQLNGYDRIWDCGNITFSFL